MLSNPIYAGKIAHKGEQYDGQHAAIIDRKTWDAVQAQLAANTSAVRCMAPWPEMRETTAYSISKCFKRKSPILPWGKATTHHSTVKA